LRIVDDEKKTKKKKVWEGAKGKGEKGSVTTQLRLVRGLEGGPKKTRGDLRSSSYDSSG